MNDTEAGKIRAAVEARVAEEAARSAPETETGDGITPEFIRQCLSANELGDGRLFANLYRDRFLYNKSAGEWFEWGGHHWRRDVMGNALAAVEGIVACYLQEYQRAAQRVGEIFAAGEVESNASELAKLRVLQRDLLRRIAQLRAEKRRAACLHFAHTMSVPLAVTGDEFDDRPMLFPVANGVIDLETGLLHPGNPGDYLTKASPVHFQGIEEPCPVWTRTLLQVFGGDADEPADSDRNESAARLSGYFLRLIGYAATGLTTEKTFPVLFGRNGWNGRSTIMETLAHVFGPMAATIPSEMLMQQRNGRSAAGPSPDIMSLKGVRLAVASEIDEGQRFSASRVKWLTGRDTLAGRNPHDKFQTNFSPTHKLFLMTNTQPSAPATDRAFWLRMALIPFNVSFVNRDPIEPHERRAILDLDRQLLKEAPGILASILRGCLAWQRGGLRPPPEVTEATEKYRRDEDIVGDFLAENCRREPHGKEKSSHLYARFVEWYHENVGKTEPSGTWFGKQITGRFEKVRIHGVRYYVGLELKP